MSFSRWFSFQSFCASTLWSLTPLVFTSTSKATAWGGADGPASAGGGTGEDVVPRTLASPLVSGNHEDEVVVLVALSAEC